MRVEPHCHGQAGEVGQSGGSETLVTVLEPSMRAGGGQRGALDRTERARLHSGRFSLAKGGEGSRQAYRGIASGEQLS